MTAIAQEDYRRRMVVAKATREELEIDEQIKKYEDKLKNLGKELRIIDTKKKRVLKALDANRSRHTIVHRDVQETSYRLDDIREHVRFLGKRLDRTRESNQKELKDAKALRKSINAQLTAVDEHINAIKNMGTGWEYDSRESLDRCEEARVANIHAFDRWHSVWPALQVVLNADTESPVAVSAMASLQGFVHEWVALRTLACDIKALSENQSRGPGKSADATAHAFKLALSSLKTRANNSSSQSVTDIFKLKREVAALEKQRRQLRGLFLDLSYALEEDCSNAMMAAKQMVMASHERQDPQRQTPLDGGSSVDSVQVNLSEHVSTPLGPESGLDPILVRTSEAVAAQRRKHGEYGGGGGQVWGHLSLSPSGTLTQKWLQALHLKTNSVLSKGITMALAVKDPSIFTATTADSKHHNHGHNRRVSKTETRVPFGHVEPTDPKHSSLQEGNDWKQLTGEELRAALVALETRSGWGHLQLAATKYMSQCLSSAESEWFYLMEKNAYGASEELQAELRNGITISVEGSSGDIRHTYPLTRPGTTIGEPSSSQARGLSRAGASAAGDILREGIDQYQRVIAFRRLIAQSAFASNTFAPAPPQLVVLQTMKVARGPVVRHQASVYHMKKSEQERIVAELMKKPPGEKLPQFTPKAVGRKRKVNSQIDRNLRKSERMQRVKTLVRKFQASAEHISQQQGREGDKQSLERPRGAVVEKPERFHIPRYVPKLDSFEELESVKPSEILHRSRSKMSAADSESSDDSDSEEEARLLLEEVAEAELDHITRGIREEDEEEVEEGREVLPRGGLRSAVGANNIDQEKYSMMERLIEKEVGDQVITQLTLKMGGDAINVVVYWQAKEEALKINAFCFAGSEEYSCVLDQNAVEQIFEGMPHLQAAQMQSPYLLHSIVERMKIEKMRRNDALAVMMRLRASGGRRTASDQPVSGRMSALDSYSVDSIISGKSLVNDLTLSRLASDEEEDRVRVVTFRAAGSQALVACCIAKVRNSQWERMMKAVPHNVHRINSVEEMLARPAPKLTSQRSTVY